MVNLQLLHRRAVNGVRCSFRRGIRIEGRNAVTP
jgi:hypothetical protein